LTYTHHHDPNSRPRPFNPTTHQPACTHTRNPSLSSSPFPLMIIRFPCSLHVSPALSPLVFTIFFLTFFLLRCLYLPVSLSGSGFRPLINRPSTTSRPSIGFSLIHLALVLTGSTYLEIHGNPKQHRIGKHLDIFLFPSFNLDSKIRASCTTFTLALSSSLYSPKYNSTNVQ